MHDHPTVAIIAERRYLDDRVLRDTRSGLEAAGCEVALVVPDAGQLFAIPTEAPAWDAVLSRGRSPVGLGLLAAVANLGVRAINKPSAIELVRNKIAMQAILLEHRLPVPRTWFAADAHVFRSMPREYFPLVVKPFDGDSARGLALLTRPEDVDLLAPIGGPTTLYLAQEHLTFHGWDLKLYGVGTRVWAVRKPSPVRFDGPGPATMVPVGGAEPVALDARLRDIALTCGRACGLEVWGVDVAVTPDGPRVIEVNDFPTYSSVPEAGATIAQYVLTAVQFQALVRQAGRDQLLSVVRDLP